MALSFSSCSDRSSQCRIDIDGQKVVIYDPQGNVCKSVTIGNSSLRNSWPTYAYWDGNRVLVETGSGATYYITNAGVGIL